MTSNIAACVAALAGAFFLALAAALQQRGAAAAPGRGTLHPALLLDLARTPVWLAGIIAGLVGVALQVMALRWGPLALVQPVGVTTLLFALPVGAARWGRRVSRVEMYAAAAVALGLGGLLMTLRPASASPALDQGRLTTLGLIVATGLIVCVCGAFRLRGSGRTILLAAGAGVAFGTTAALVEVLVHRAVDHGPSVLASWLTLATFAASVSGFLLCQGAYRSGRLSTALATILVLDPLTAIGVGVFALREPVSTGFPLAIGAETLLLVAGIVVLARPSHGRRREHPASSSASLSTVPRRPGASSSAQTPTFRMSTAPPASRIAWRTGWPPAGTMCTSWRSRRRGRRTGSPQGVGPKYKGRERTGWVRRTAGRERRPRCHRAPRRSGRPPPGGAGPGPRAGAREGGSVPCSGVNNRCRYARRHGHQRTGTYRASRRGRRLAPA